MISTNRTEITKDLENKKLNVTRHFNAPVEKVWRAWTEPELLDKWWAPKPWRTETKSMNFAEGGMWLYSMVGPEGERHWSKANYLAINPEQSFTGIDGFCDEEGNTDTSLPLMTWHVNFLPTDNGTNVLVEITFETEEALNTIVEMGFEEGFTSAHGNLDELLAGETK